MISMKEIFSLSRRITPLEKGDFIYVHPRSCDINSSSDKSSYFGGFLGYADEENFYEVDLNVDVEFCCERGVWVPRRNTRNKGGIARVNTLEDNGYLLFSGEREIEKGMDAHHNPHYGLVRKIIQGPIHRSVHDSQRRARDKIKYA